MARNSLSKRLRFEVFKRDGFRCVYCGRTPPDVTLEADHVVPESAGGPTDTGNLVTSCFDCNRGKADVSLKIRPECVTEINEMERDKVDQMREYNLWLLQQKEELDQMAMTLSDHWIAMNGGNVKKECLWPSEFVGVKRFLKRLSLAFCLEAVEIAYAKFPWNRKTQWKYFCGICWREIKKKDGLEGNCEG